MNKRIVAFIITLAMVVSFIPQAAFAAEETLADTSSGAAITVSSDGAAETGEYYGEDYDWAKYDWEADPLANDSLRQKLSLTAQLAYRQAKEQYAAPVLFSARSSASINSDANALSHSNMQLNGAATEEDDAFLISAAGQLAELAEYTNEGNTTFNAAQYRQTADIDLSVYRSADSKKGWTPIGCEAYPFKGTYDGDGNSITGLYINRGGSGGSDDQGLFGYVDGACLSNIIVKDADVTGRNNTGAVLGHGTGNSELKGCAMLGGSVVGTANVNITIPVDIDCVGGIAGYLNGSMKNCFSTGNVGGEDKIGGVAGEVSGSVTGCFTTGFVNGVSSIGGVTGSADSLANCYSTGSVSGTGGNVGGVAGEVSGDVTCCYSISGVTASGDHVGGIAGAVGGNMTSCVALGQNAAGTGTNVYRVAGSGSVGGCYAWGGMKVNGNTVTAGAAANQNGANLSYTSGAAEGSKLSIQFSAIFGTANDAWIYTTDGLPKLKNAGGTQSAELPSWITNGDANIFYITTAAELKQLADEVNGKVPDGSGFKAPDNKSGKTYILKNDINLLIDHNSQGWEPIGTSSNPFSGVLDGGGHAISGLYIQRREDNQGLFGYVKGVSGGSPAQVKDLTIQGQNKISLVVGGTNTGAMVGYYGSNTGKLLNCKVLGGKVNGDQATGGVVGNLDAGSGGIENCYATCSISIRYDNNADTEKNNSVGGIAGIAQSNINECHFSGKVDAVEIVQTEPTIKKGYDRVGGIVGWLDENATVTNCYSTGTISSEGTNGTDSGDGVGGIAGWAKGSIVNCFSTCSVSGGNNVGGVAGEVSGSVEKCFATGFVNGIGNIGGVAGSVTGSVANCYSTGNVVGTGDKVGGVAGNVSGSVTCCYSISGANSSGDHAGGVAGAAGSIVKCAALGQIAKGTGTNVYRVANSGSVSGCYAWSGMKVKDSTVPNEDPRKGADKLHGADISYSDDALTPQIANIFGSGSDSPWDFTENGLPILKDMPRAASQSAELPSWITGGNQNTFYITTAAELKQLADAVNGGDDKSGITYILKNDIDLSAYRSSNGAYGWTPIGVCKAASGKPFAGKFDGGGHTVTGLYIGTAENSSYPTGLFGRVNGKAGVSAQITSVTIKNAEMNNGSSVGAVVGEYGAYTLPLTSCGMLGGVINVRGSNVGGVVGLSEQKVENCYATGSVKASNGSGSVGGVTEMNVGGVVGNLNADLKGIENCYATGSVEADRTISVGNLNVGGVAGKAKLGVTDCYSTGDVTGKRDSNSESSDNVGGVVGWTQNVERCYATGSVTNKDILIDGNYDATCTYIGGIAGQISGTASNCVAINRKITGADNSHIGRISGRGAINNDCCAWQKIDLTPTDGTTPQGTQLTIRAGYLMKDGAKFNWSASNFTAGYGWTVPNAAFKLPYLDAQNQPTFNLAQSAGLRVIVTLNKNSGTGGTSSVTATLLKAMPALTGTNALPMRPGYDFTGYYDAITGGTKYYNAKLRNYSKYR